VLPGEERVHETTRADLEPAHRSQDLRGESRFLLGHLLDPTGPPPAHHVNIRAQHRDEGGRYPDREAGSESSETCTVSRQRTQVGVPVPRRHPGELHRVFSSLTFNVPPPAPPRRAMHSEDSPTSDPPARVGPEEWDVHAGPDVTLRGYFQEHNRPPGFEGADGEPYTVSIESREDGQPRLSPCEGYLVFPRWASTGLGVVGHVETPTLRGPGARASVVAGSLAGLPLVQCEGAPGRGDRPEPAAAPTHDHPEPRA
jgi:hypothetical protein